MSNEQLMEKGTKGDAWRKGLEILIVLVLVPATLVASRYFGNRKYYLCSVLLIFYGMAVFFLQFEKRKPQAREIVTLSVMCAIAVASRAAFVMIAHFKPMTGIIIITGMAFGPEAGFLAGAVSGFVSNFIFGQGPWTPWQMFAFGIAGFVGGFCAKKGFLTGDKPLRSAVFGGVLVLFVVGPILDTCSLFTLSTGISSAAAKAIYLSGIPVNLIHALATFLTLWVLSKPMLEKLERIQIKYGMMEK